MPDHDSLPPFVDLPPILPALLSSKRKRLLIGYACLFAAAVLLTVWQTRTLQDQPSVENQGTTSTAASVATNIVAINTTTTNATIVRVVDGDTIVVWSDVTTKEETVRLLGVNTPEVVDPRKPVECFGKEASAYAKSVMKEGDRIRLDPDPQADDVDKYHRLLRNVVLADGTDFNASLVRQGYAYAYLSFPLNRERKAELKRLENEAKTAQRGLWNPQTCKGKE